jgi:NADH:ubiquinone oxidoreductase subunit H
MQLKLRIIFDAIVTIVSICLALYFGFQWVKHGYPLYGYDDMLGGIRKTILPFLWLAILLVGLAFVAVIDFFAHKD